MGKSEFDSQYDAEPLQSSVVTDGHPSRSSSLVQWQNERLIIAKHWIVTSRNYQIMNYRRGLTDKAMGFYPMYASSILAGGSNTLFV